MEYSRPIRVYLWYPAVGSEELQPMRFGRYAELADDDIWPEEIVGELHERLGFSSRPLARSLGGERFNALLKQQVTAVEDAAPLDGPFPLIVVGQGVYYESPIVFAALGEYLATKGFVVATSPLSGTNSPIVTVDVKGLETQVRDLEFVIGIARKLPFVSEDKLGVFGFDMGGMAGLILSMRNIDVDAFASVSSGILYPHPAGIPGGSPDYDPSGLRVPWLHSVPSAWIKQPNPSGEQSLYDTARYSDRYLLLTEGMGHVDYTGYALIEGRPSMVEYWEAAEPGDADRFWAVYSYVATFFAAYLRNESGSVELLSGHQSKLNRDSTMTIEYRPATTPPITYEEFVQAVVSGQAEQAIDEVRSLNERHPGHALLNEEYLNRLVYSLRGTWGLDKEILPLLKFIVEQHPESANAKFMLAEGQARLGRYSEAIEIYTKMLELDADGTDDYIESRLEWLESR